MLIGWHNIKYLIKVCISTEINIVKKNQRVEFVCLLPVTAEISQQ